MPGYWFEHVGQRVCVDVAGQVVRAELEAQADGGERQPAVYDGPTADDEAFGPESIVVYQQGHTWAAPTYASVADAGVTPRFTPLFALAMKAKATDDRIMCALERLIHEGAGRYGGCLHWLETLRLSLAEGTDARGLLDAAAHMRGEPFPEAGASRLRARKWVAKFLKDKKASEPAGIYTRSEWLGQMFRHDRLLQTTLPAGAADALRGDIERGAGLSDRYRAHLALLAQISGGLVGRSVLEGDGDKRALVPASDSLEGRLIRELFSDAPIPEGFKLGAELVARIGDGRLDPTPHPNGGWYARQFYANAALLSPETEGLEVGPLYAGELAEVFQALFALTRETHTKQLDLPAGAGMPLLVRPQITIEPIPAYYQRVGAGYRFLRETLCAHVGDVAIRDLPASEDGPGLYDALVSAESLFEGAAAASRRELGQADAPGPQADVAVAAFRAWQAASAADPDMQADMRVAVPTYYDEAREKVRVSVTLGVETRTLRLSFVKEPAVTVLGEPAGPFGPSKPEFEPRDVQLLSPITIECDVDAPPSRERLREICDAHAGPEAIRAALERG